jgi:hypothetical protein
MMIGDSGTVFEMISVAVMPSMSGMLISMRMTCGRSFFARVTEGLPVVARLFRVPTRGETQDEDAYTLLAPVKIHRVTIRK